ncbi:MAG TPA: universal stress protein [Steroidobacteraceae bacterium]|nr:universal stress protein [Steroidobacteraceae bacterium]
MTTYQRILAVLDLASGDEEVARRALAIAMAAGAAPPTLLHVVEYVPPEPLNDSLLPAAQLEAELLARARSRMAALAARLGPPVPPWRVAAGNVKNEILRTAREGGHDLIVIGSHERHGLSILVNMTEDTVLHGAPCDVLAVRLAAAGRGG